MSRPTWTIPVVTLLFLTLLTTPLPAAPFASLPAGPGVILPGTDPAERPVHRHLLPPEAVELVLKQGDVRLLGWSELTEILARGRRARQEAAEKKESEAKAALARLPFHFTSLEAELEVRPGATDARLELRAGLEVTDDGYLAIPLIGPTATPEALEAKRPDGSPGGHLVPVQQGHGVLVKGPGTRELVLTAWVPVHQDGYLRRVEVRVPPVAGTRAALRLPGENLQVFTDPAPEPRVLRTSEGTTVAEAVIPPGAPLRVQWFSREAGLGEDAGADEEGPAVASTGLQVLGERLLATWAQTLVFGHGRLEALVRLRLEVLRAPLDRIRLRVEGETENLTVSRTSGLLERVENREDGLEVFFKRRRSGTVELDLSYRIQRDAASFRAVVPRFDLVEGTPGQVLAERHYYWIGRATNVQVTAPEGPGFEAIGPQDFAGFATHPQVRDALMRFRRTDGAAPLELTVQRFPDAPGVLTRVVDRATITTTLSAHGRASSRVALEVRDRSGDPLPVLLPEGAVATEFFLAGKRVDPPRGADGAHNVPLREAGRAAAESLKVEFVYHQPVVDFREVGRVEVPLVQVDAPIMQLDWTVTPPDRYLLYGPGDVGRRHGDGLRFSRSLIPAPGSMVEARPLQVRCRYLSHRARSLLRMLGLLLGTWAGLLICRLLVGALPLQLGLGLLAPLLVLLLAPEPGIVERCALGAVAAFLFGALVGVRRWLFDWWNRSPRPAAAGGGAAGRTDPADLPAFRAELEARIREQAGPSPEGEPPEPGGPPSSGGGDDPPPDAASDADSAKQETDGGQAPRKRRRRRKGSGTKSSGKKEA